MNRLHSQDGFGFAAVLIAMLILAALYFGYFSLPGVKSERSAGVAAIDSSRAVACRTNRQNIERDMRLWKVNHADEEPSLAALDADGLRVPSCPEGGHYDLSGGHVRCSAHD